MNNREKGTHYETLAMEFFQGQGYEILEQNYRTKIGEIDFIGKKDGKITFVEVKYRKSSNFGIGSESVDIKKRKKIYLVSQQYLQENDFSSQDISYDLIMFTGEKLEWIKNILRGDEIGC